MLDRGAGVMILGPPETVEQSSQTPLVFVSGGPLGGPL
jgi:hypothetical protein